MQLNGEFELLLTIEDWVEGDSKQIPSLMSVNKCSVILQKRSEAGQFSLSFDHCYISSVSLYTEYVLHKVSTDQMIVINKGITQYRK